MRKFLSILLVSGALLGGENCLAADLYEIAMTSDHIVAKLSAGTQVPQEDIVELFDLIAKPKKVQVEQPTDRASLNRLDVSIMNFKNSITNLWQDSEDELPLEITDSIGRFTTQVSELKSFYPPKVIENALSLILMKS